MKTNMDENVRLRRTCLKLISSIAKKGAALPQPDVSRSVLRLLSYGVARYNYNNPDMGASRARKELRDLEQMCFWLKRIDSEGRRQKTKHSRHGNPTL